MVAVNKKPNAQPEDPRALTGTAQVDFLEAALWQKFATASSDDDFYLAWLGIQCSMIGQIVEAVVFLESSDGDYFLPRASWPANSRAGLMLWQTAELAVVQGRGVVQAGTAAEGSVETDKRLFKVAYPLKMDERTQGVVALRVVAKPGTQLQAVLRQLQWGAGWFEVLYRRRQLEDDLTNGQRLFTAIDLTAAALEHGGFRVASSAFVTEIALRLDCDRVSLGLVKGRRAVVMALSHSAHFNRRMNLIRAIEMAMDETIDQQETILYARLEPDRPQVTRSHAALARQQELSAVLTVPLSDGKRSFGALTFERSDPQPFDARTVELCECIGTLVGPILREKWENDRWLIAKAHQSLREQLEKLLGPEHVARKLVTAVLLAGAIFLTFATGTYRVTSDAVLEGQVRRVITAPFDGYVVDARVRPGDTVAKSDVMVSLDDTELRLERLGWDSQKQQLIFDLTDAQARHDRAKVNVLSALIDQAEAQLALIDSKLARTKLLAPFDGLVVRGDLSQDIGKGVQQGEELFELAPLESYRVILKVDERDIAEVRPGQAGVLTLTALPDEGLPFAVTKITAASVAEEGRNYFRVEAALQSMRDNLRPGMEGAGKVAIEDRRLVWIWTHRLIDWFRLWIWRWWP